MALIGARERRDMANVETDLQKQLKGKPVFSIEVQSPTQVRFFYEAEVSNTQGKRDRVILHYDAYGKRDRILKEFAGIYDRSWRRPGEPSGAPHNFGDGLIYVSLRGPGGDKYVNIAFLRKKPLDCDSKGMPVLWLKNNHEVRLVKDTRKNLEKIEEAKALLHRKSLEIQDKERQMLGEDVPLTEASSYVSAVSSDEQPVNQEKDTEANVSFAQVDSIRNLQSKEQRKRKGSNQLKLAKIDRMKEELIDSVSLSEAQVADLEKIPSVEMRRMVERNQKAEMLQSISNQMMIFFAGLV